MSHSDFKLMNMIDQKARLAWFVLISNMECKLGQSQ